jgi:hypothetical protein
MAHRDDLPCSGMRHLFRGVIWTDQLSAANGQSVDYSGG